MSFILTPVATDTFQRADENPLTVVNWTKEPNGGFSSPVQNLKIVSDRCVAQGNGAVSWNIYTGAVFPNDQYSEITIDGGSDPLAAYFYIASCRSAGGIQDGYIVFVNQATNASTNHMQLFVTNGASFTALSSNLVTPRFVTGDVLRLICIGTQITVTVNGSVIITATDSTKTSGVPGLGILQAAGPVVPPGISKFVGGAATSAIAYSVPDDRNFGNFPNSSRNVQNTLTYDVPSVFSLRYWFDKMFNQTQPLPVDSRISIPADSRTVGNIPENSRAPGTFGPGE